MPNELHKKLDALLASIGFNDGANKGFWRYQPREKFGEDAGQWIEMGAELRMFFKDQRGKTDSVPGKAVGSTGNPNGVRVLVQGQSKKGVPDGIYGADTANVRIAKGIIPEETLRKQGIKSAPKISREQEATLPTIDSLERADITDGDIRLINEGAESKEAKQQADYKKSVEAKEKKEAAPSAPEETKDPIAEVMADVAYNGDTDAKVDDLVESLKKADTEVDSRKSDPSLRETRSINLEKGDVIRTRDGKDGTVLDVKLDLSQGGQSSIRVQNEDGSISNVPIDPAKPFYVVKDKKGKVAKPAKPAAPEAKPTPSPAKPAAKTEKPSTPSEPKPENTLAPTPPPNFPPAGRIDDDLDIEMARLNEEQFSQARNKKATPLLRPDGVPEKYIDEKGKIQNAQDPFSLMNVLAETYPNAKFSKDGLSLILFRTKDKDGKIFELRASNSNQKVVNYSMRWTAPDTGEIEELFHYDSRDSVQALFRKDNGPDALLDRILGRNGKETIKNGNSTWGPDATYRDRAKWFQQKQKMFTAADTALQLANGPATIFHIDDKNFGRIKKTGNSSVWDMVDKLFDGNPPESLKDDIYLSLEQIMSRVATTDLAHNDVLTALRTEYANRFGARKNDAVNRTMTALFTNASQKAKGKGFKREKDPGFRANPHASANRHTPIETGMVVEYENNEGIISIVKVRSKHKNRSVAAGRGNDIYDFGDFVEIEDSEGITRTLASKELRILKDQNTPLTPYTPNPINDALIDYRIRMGLIRPRGERQKSTVPGDIDSIDIGRPEPKFTAVIDDLVPGDDIYDQDGVFLGEILEVQPTQDDDGNDGFAFLISDVDGDRISVFYPRGTEVDSAAEIPGVTSSKEPTDTDPDETVFYRMMAEDTPLSSSINPVPDASSIDAPVGEPAEDTGGKKEVQETKTAVEKVLSVMLEAIKNGEVPWRKPFTDDPKLAGASLPRNPKTKHIYSGTNRLILRFIADEKGYEDGRWLTYNNAQEMGGQVRKGEKATYILAPRIIPVKGKDGKPVLDDKGNKKSFVRFDAIPVFNVAQIDGLNLPDESKNIDLQAKTPLQAQEFVISRYLKSMEALGLDIPKIRYTYVGEYGSHSSSPNWSPNSDVITLPTLEQFNSPEEIFDTLMHELAHSTGHKSRLDRTELTKDYGNSDGVARAKEELIAEISSALFQQMFGITSNLDNSAAYVQSWLKRLQNNPEEVINATKEAQKVVDYMLGTHLGDWSPVDGYSTKGA